MTIGSGLEDAAALAVSEAWIIAPYMKEAPLRRLLSYVRPTVRLVVITRWHPADIASGVSDLACRQVVKEYDHSDFRISPLLHAKYYRFDDRSFVGSANLTMRGLGWRHPSNIELLVDSPPLPEFEAAVVAQSTPATDTMQDLVEKSASHIAPEFYPADFEPRAVEADLSVKTPETSKWLPNSRIPGDLFAIQLGRLDDYSRSAIETAIADLNYLNIPPCSNESIFNLLVASSLVRQPLIASFIELTRIPRRFGEIREWITTMTSTQANPDLCTQALYRWAYHFLPEIFTITRPNYSEMIQSR